VDYATELLLKRDDITIIVPAEGTRKAVEKWKTGFYHIAVKSGKNISLGYLDYAKKYAGILDVIPAGTQKATFDQIQRIYENVTAKYPELYNKVIH
jgi:1-acyl-sn-glycerol-3-phosphate acyltransferase